MATQYYMRGYNTSAPGAVGYVDWVVNDMPDSAAVHVPSPYVSGNIVNISVNRVVPSKVDNFLKPFGSLAAIGTPGFDGYFFHLNSYDWLHTTPPGPPISVPSYLTGLSVVRGSVDGITPRDYVTLFWDESVGKWIFAYNTAGDGTTIGAALPVAMGSLEIDGYLAVGTNPAQSGVIRIPNNEALKARNASNTSDVFLIESDVLDRVQVGSVSDSVYVPSSLRIDGYVRDSGNPSLSGFLRNSNNTNIITFRDVADLNDIVVLSSTSGDLIKLGDDKNSGIRFDTATGAEHIFQVNSSNLFRIGNAGGTTYGAFESDVNFPTILQRDTTVGNGQDFRIQAQSTSDFPNVGGSIVVSSGTGPGGDGYVDLRANNVPKIRIFGPGVPVTADFPNNSVLNPDSTQIFTSKVRFYDTVYSPTISHDSINTTFTSASPMFIQSQSATGANSNGGTLILSSGNGTLAGGDFFIKTGTGVDIEPASINGPAYVKHGKLFMFAGSPFAVAEFFADGYGPFFSVGGSLSAPAAIDGYVRVPNNVWALSAARNPATPPNASIHLIGTDIDNKILIGDELDTTYIAGTLIVGTFNSSTVLEVEDRIITANYNVAEVGIPVPPPALITGLTIHRGNDAALLHNDEAGFVWVEGVNIDASDGYWKAASVLNGNDINLSISLNIMAASLSITNDPNPVGGSLPTIGGLRTLNDSVAVAARNVAGTLDISLLKTDSTDHVLLGDAVNAGVICNVSTGSIYDFQVNSVSTYTITPDSSGTTTLQAVDTVTALVYKQADLTVASGTGAPTTIQAQNETGATSVGGALNLTSGTGTTANGAVNLQSGGVTVVSTVTDQFIFNKGHRRNVRSITTTDTVTLADDYLAITASSVYTVDLPATPAIGDTYEFKDINGTSGTNTVTISGNGNNIDGAATILMNGNFMSFIVTYTGTQWSVS